MAATEYIILVNENDSEIGHAEKMIVHKNNWLHRAFSIFIFRQTETSLELLLQQRGLNKYHSPGLWTNTCCSHPHPGESIVVAGKRRLKQELGITTDLQDLGSFQYQATFTDGLSEHEIDHVLVGMIDKDLLLSPDPTEIHAIRWITWEALQQELADHPERFTPWLDKALKVIDTQEILYT